MAGIDIKITGFDNETKKFKRTDLHQHGDGPIGIDVYTIDHDELDPKLLQFFNEANGSNMAVNAAFGANASIIHDGGSTSSKLTGTATSQNDNHLLDSGETFSTIVVGMGVHNTSDTTYASVIAVNANDLTLDANIFPVGNENYTLDPVWTGSAVQGSWDFSSGNVITLSSGVDQDSATFDTTGTITYDTSNFTALTGTITLSTYNGATNDLILSFDLAGTPVGNVVNLNDYINTNDFAAQNFAIPLVSLGLATGTVDGFTITLSRSGGPQAAMTFDNIQLEESGGLTYTATPSQNTEFHANRILLTVVNNVTEAVMQAYDKFGGDLTLTDGMFFQNSQNGDVLFTLSLSNLTEFIAAGFSVKDLHSDGTNTILALEVQFFKPIKMKGRDSLSFSLSDDYSGLLHFSALVSGAEIIEG